MNHTRTPWLRAVMAAAPLCFAAFSGTAHAQIPAFPTVAGVPFYPNVFGAAATSAAGSKVQAPKAVPGAPRNVYVGHASVVLWVDEAGVTKYSAAVAQHSSTFAMSMGECRKQNGGSDKNCVKAFDAVTPVLAVVKASDGGYYFTKGESRAEARKKGMEACEKRANVTCAVDKLYGTGGGLLDF
jgi:hypothetical protein